MQPISNVWKQIFSEIGHSTEVKAVIAGIEYDISKIYAATQSRSIYPDGAPGVGSCVASSITLSVIPQGKIPRMAEIKLYVRLVSADRSEYSEWIPGGTYYIDTRQIGNDGMTLAITAYDSMLKGDRNYGDLTQITNWPHTETEVVRDIATLIGVTVDSRNELHGYQVPYPSDLTMREVLGYIAGANGGNWTITPDNKLRLIKYGKDISVLGVDDQRGILFGDSIIVLTTGYHYDDTSSAGTDIQRNVQRFNNLGKLDAYTGVKIWYDREATYEEQSGEKVAIENAYFAGDDDGRVLEIDCPWATQAMADAILNEIQGYAYQGAEAERAEVTPAAELGDQVICDGVLFDLAKYDVTYTGAYLPNISAPADEEVDYEYRYTDKTDRELTRRVKLGESYFGFRTTRENGIEVVSVDNGQETTRMILNSNVQAFYNADGTEALYFDAVAGKYKFVGDVTITDGSINVNNNFIVDRYGNVVSNGSIHLQGSDTVIHAPKIFSDSFSVYPENYTIPSTHIENSGFNLYDLMNNRLYHFLRIYQYSEYTSFSSPAGGYASWEFAQTSVSGGIDITGKSRYYGSGATGSGSEIATLSDIPDVSNYVTATQVQAMIDAAIGPNGGN